MTTETPITQPPVEDLRNALTVAEWWSQIGHVPVRDVEKAFADITRLIRHALEQLGEPNAAMIQAVQKVVESHSPLMAGHESPTSMAAYWRDISMVVLNAQVRGEFPVARATIVTEEP